MICERLWTMPAKTARYMYIYMLTVAERERQFPKSETAAARKARELQ